MPIQQLGLAPVSFTSLLHKRCLTANLVLFPSLLWRRAISFELNVAVDRLLEDLIQLLLREEAPNRYLRDSHKADPTNDFHLLGGQLVAEM